MLTCCIYCSMRRLTAWLWVLASLLLTPAGAYENGRAELIKRTLAAAEALLDPAAAFAESQRDREAFLGQGLPAGKTGDLSGTGDRGEAGGPSEAAGTGTEAALFPVRIGVEVTLYGESPGDDSGETQAPDGRAGEAQTTEPGSGSAVPVMGPVMRAPLPYDMAALRDFSHMLRTLYVVDPMTTAQGILPQADELLSHDFTMEVRAEPQILIYHTHSQETFADSVPGDASMTICGVGDELTRILTQEYGLGVIHDKTAYDIAGGSLDRSQAYTYAEQGMQEILRRNPSIEVIIDLHRDGVGENVRLVTDIDGRPTAKIMFFNGLSHDIYGPIEYLENPYREENLAFSFQLRMQADALYPSFVRTNYLHCYCYNLHLRPKSLLVEVGAQTNTFEEAKNAMRPLADVLWHVLQGQ